MHLKHPSRSLKPRMGLLGLQDDPIRWSGWITLMLGDEASTAMNLPAANASEPAHGYHADLGWRVTSTLKLGHGAIASLHPCTQIPARPAFTAPDYCSKACATAPVPSGQLCRWVWS